MEHPLQQDVVFSRFAAVYLPALVNKYLRPPPGSTSTIWRKSIALEDLPLANAYGYMLVHLNGNPYWSRYLRQPATRPVVTELIETLITRLDERTNDWEARLNNPTKRDQEGGISIPSMIYDFCQLTTSLLLLESEEHVYHLNRLPAVKHLMPFLSWWNDRFAQVDEESQTLDSEPSDSRRHTLSQEEDMKKQWPAYQLRMVLINGEDENETAALRIARSMKGGLHKCAMAGCDKQYATDGGALLQCSRCGTVRYVCAPKLKSTIEFC